METIFVREQDKVAEKIRRLERDNKDLKGEIGILKLRLAALEAQGNERKPSSEPTGSKTAVRKGKKAVTPAV